MEKRIPVQQFDLQRFIEDTKELIRCRLPAKFDPCGEIPTLDEDDSIFDIEPEDTGRDLVREITLEKKQLFFPFSADSGSRSPLGIRCADGLYHEFCLADCFSSPNEDEEDSEHVVTVEYSISDYDFVGFIVSVDHDGMLLIQEATLFTEGQIPCYPIAERKRRFPLFVEESALEAFIERFCINE